MTILKSRRVAMIAALVLTGFAANAYAAMIRFDFTGSVYSAYSFDASGAATQLPSYLGQSVTGSMLIDTNGLVRSTQDGQAAASLSFTNNSPAPDLITSSLIIGDAHYNIGVYPANSGGIRYVDSHGPISCGDGCSSMTPDSFLVSDGSAEVWGTPVSIPTSYSSRFLSISSTAWADDPLNPGTSLNYIDLTQNLDATSILSLPLQTQIFRGVTGLYSEQVTTCTSSSCVGSSRLALGFDIASIARADVSPVPLPSSLSMLILGIGLLAVLRKSNPMA